MSYLKNRKKMVLTIMGVAAFAAAVVFNVSLGSRGESMSDLTLANIEALATSETSDEFTGSTCCVACTDKVSCDGCDGRTHSYAYRQ
jgi:hypothetical protein